MKKRLVQRLTELQAQKAEMERQIADLQQTLIYGQQNLLAISGAIQELEQLLQPAPQPQPVTGETQRLA
jgi:hypothetical protein